MQFFRMMTYGQTVYMGGRTYDSMGSPLTHRINCMLSSRKDKNFPTGLVTYSNKEKFLTRIANDENGFVIGGQQIYELALGANVIKNIYLSRIDDYTECDRFFNIPDSFRKISTMSFPGLVIERWVNGC
jgi:dihydrofolate reductase